MTIKRVSLKKLALIAFSLLLVGCALPKNAEEFRQFTRNSPFKLIETYEVARPLQDVSSTLKKKASECLAVTIDWTIDYGLLRPNRSGKDTYKPTFIATPKRAEIHVQLNRSAVTTIGSPPDGPYRVVLDATSIEKNKTRIDTYVMSNVEDGLILKAMRGWVTGDNLGCPDLTKK